MEPPLYRACLCAVSCRRPLAGQPSPLTGSGSWLHTGALVPLGSLRAKLGWGCPAEQSCTSAPPSPPGVSPWGLGRVWEMGLLAGGGASGRAGTPNRPPPALAADVGGAGQLGTAARAFFFGRLPHPHFIEEILGAQRRMQLARATPRPLSGSSPSGV